MRRMRILDREGCSHCTRRLVVQALGATTAASLLGLGCGGGDDAGPDAGDPLSLRGTRAGIAIAAPRTCARASAGAPFEYRRRHVPLPPHARRPRARAVALLPALALALATRVRRGQGHRD